jgi:hypothetical protein
VCNPASFTRSLRALPPAGAVVSSRRSRLRRAHSSQVGVSPLGSGVSREDSRHGAHNGDRYGVLDGPARAVPSRPACTGRGAPPHPECACRCSLRSPAVRDGVHPGERGGEHHGELCARLPPVPVAGLRPTGRCPDQIVLHPPSRGALWCPLRGPGVPGCAVSTGGGWLHVFSFSGRGGPRVVVSGRCGHGGAGHLPAWSSEVWGVHVFLFCAVGGHRWWRLHVVCSRCVSVGLSAGFMCSGHPGWCNTSLSPWCCSA